ncbi:GAF domain-containing protein [Xenophilus arseniciresistens]|uniref:histidine kinase n=1 Tax=Xenophilus arseniciresistens TaxID=1283306 RepID=A0AAE3NEN6_9BURK|nr:ATP-binding protein [Xenophilus arseniciresistens]MDA7418902.1 GAF domain-containing protein [Xenophilus arseniciresistens]
MTTAPPSVPAVNLENCDREPIHVPGAIQPHGALLAFDASMRVCHASANAAQLLGASAPVLGQALAAAHFEGLAAVHALIRDVAALPATDTEVALQSDEVALNGQRFDLVVHRSGPLLVTELEQRPAGDDDVAAFALRAHRAMDRLKRQSQVDALLALAVRVMRELAGFDRVMAYRFRDDDSGEVVAEDRHEALEPFAGRRYPASDIPAQARRLYLLNTLRLIADVHAQPVPVLGADLQAGALDMSHGVLRSVSPIHIEYLRNMGVGASMSISIVINGRLWGMLACHHRSARRVPYAVRMACDVLAQVLAANVQTLLAREQAEWAEEGAQLRSRLVQGMLHAENTVGGLAALAEPLTKAFNCEAMLLAEEARLFVHGSLPHGQAQALLQWVQAQPMAGSELLAVQDLPHRAPALEAAGAGWCGLLALRLGDAGGWLVLLRREQVETIRWGGKPEKQYTVGPLGPRLTPRGSFDVWLQEVRGTSLPWTEAQRELGRQLLADLSRASAAQMAELNRARTQLLAMLGHDLRDPLQSIAMAAKVLERSEGEDGRSAAGARLGQRIQSSSSRMARLIGQVLDASRLQTGLGLQLQTAEVDLALLLEDLLDEARVAYPGLNLITEVPATLPALADADRVAQLFSNLISNARHHGAPGEAVIVQLSLQGEDVSFEVSNSAPPIPDELLPHLFSAFKRQTQPGSRNRSGLGLGLHIAQAIAQSHGGTLDYTYAEPYVVFSARFPVRPQA